MKKTWKRISVLLLALILLVQATPAVFAKGASEVEENEYPLLSHWDFNGEGAEALKDRATAGASQDAMVVNGDVTVEGGIAKVSDVAGAYLSASGAAGTDQNSMANKTLVMKAKLFSNEKRTGVAGFVTKENSFSYGISTTDCAINYVYHTYKNGSIKNSADNATTPFTMNEYRVFVMSFSYDTSINPATGNPLNHAVVKQYVSTVENPTSAADFVLLNKFDATNSATSQYESTNLTSTKPLILGKRQGHLNADKNLHAWFDDVKLYDGAMTPTEVVNEGKAPVLRGTQFATAGSKVLTKENTFGVCFVGTANTAKVEELGFKLTAQINGKGEAKELSSAVKFVYRKILADTENGYEAYDARGNFQSTYIYTLTVVNIPLELISGNNYVLFTVTPYSIAEEGDAALEGDSYTVKVTYDDSKTGYEKYVTKFTLVD